MGVCENYKVIEKKVEQACIRAGRKKEDVTLIAVSKTKPISMIQELLPAYRIVKIPCIQRIDRDPQPVFHTVQVHAAHVERFIADNL